MINNQTLKIIKQRKNTRRFTNEQIKKEELHAVLEAGMDAAPGAGHEKAWHLTVVADKELLDRLNLAGKETAKKLGNAHVRQMANNEKFNIFFGAPTVIIISGHERALMVETDCAAVTQNLLIAAEAIGLGSCWVNFISFVFNSSNGVEMQKRLGIPDNYKPYYAVVLGYKKTEEACCS